jgi:hypothetical protein
MNEEKSFSFNHVSSIDNISPDSKIKEKNNIEAGF